MGEEYKSNFPPQHQNRMPGLEKDMHPEPKCTGEWYRGSSKLRNKKAIITGGDSGIGRAVAIFFAREGADIAILYYDEHDDVKKTKELVLKEGSKCITISGDISNSEYCTNAVRKIAQEFGTINILVNNAAHQPFQENLESLTDEQLMKTFEVNVFGYFFMSRACLTYLREGDVIINTASVTAYRGSSHLLDYASTKGAEIAFTRSLARVLAPRKIRVNAVAPGPVWTPLTTSTFPAVYMKSFGKQTLMQRAGQPEEIAPSYVFLASHDSSYMTGSVIHPDGGEIVNE